ncbi:helix-turn-helix domain-containing protein [Mesobacillus harenae]|uniref:helix-turn-helix domain-containing protein n=1 Tax=Mesobacillus harenae TaxID=2213203 RepID=UPI0015812EB3|nr:helix-turn-helix domain-containing protein [Mesobacillus harenae]
MNTEKQLLSLINATKALTSTRNLDEVLQLLIKEVLSVFDWADASVLFLYDPHKKHLRAKSAVGFNMEFLKEVALQPNEGMSGKTFQLKQAQLFTSRTDTSKGMSDLTVQNMELYQSALGENHMVPTSTICAPLMNQHECFGVLTIDSFSESVEFTHDNLMLLQTFANQAMIAIENAMLISQNNRSNHIHRELTKVYMSHQGLAKITKTLADLIHKPVGVANDFFDLLSSTSESLNEISELVRDEALLWDEPPAHKQVMVNNISYDVYFFAIKIEAELTGMLIVAAEKDEVLDGLDLFAIEQATTVFALELQSHNQYISSQFSYEGYLMKEILNQPEQSMRFLKKKDLYRKNNRYVLLTIEIASELSGIKEIHGIKQSFSRLLYRHLSLFPYKSLVYENSMQCSILLIINERMDEKEIDRTGRDLVNELKSRSKLTILAGLGRSFSNMKEISYSLQDSIKCIEYLKQVNSREKDFINYLELGGYRLFLNIDPQELESFLKMNLEKLLDYDREHNAELVKTLEIFLAHNQSTRKTSENMFVHENTIKYRINNIKKILGVSQISGEIGFELNLALKIRSYLNKSHLSN